MFCYQVDNILENSLQIMKDRLAKAFHFENTHVSLTSICKKRQHSPQRYILYSSILSINSQFELQVGLIFTSLVGFYICSRLVHFLPSFDDLFGLVLTFSNTRIRDRLKGFLLYFLVSTAEIEWCSLIINK